MPLSHRDPATMPPNFMGPLYTPTLYDTTATKFCMVIKLDERKNFTGSTMPADLARSLLTRMLTCDLFAVANLLV